jgi:sulfite reductase alpha subunit-like flavoprotein
VRHIELDVCGPNEYAEHNMKSYSKSDECLYQPGDIAMIYPENDLSKSAVTDLLRSLAWSLDTVVDICYNDHDDGAAGVLVPGDAGRILLSHSLCDHRIPCPARMTLRQLFRDYLDINGRPQRSFFQRLALLAVDPIEVGIYVAL